MRSFYAMQAGGNNPFLSYMLGVLLGDGCVYRMRPGIHYRTGRPFQSWRIELSVTDREFAEAFGLAANMVLRRQERRRNCVLPPRLKNGPLCRPVYRVSIANRSFGEWWDRLGPDEIKRFALNHPADFLRGLYDSEGNVSYSDGHPIARIFSADRATLLIALACLHAIGLDGRLALFRAAGTKTNKGVSKRHLFCLSPKPARNFFAAVTSSIPRKRPRAAGYR